MEKLKVSNTAKNVIYITYVSLFVLLAIIGIVDQINGFVLIDYQIGVGTFSIFGFISLVMIALFVIYKIIILMKHKITPVPEKKS